MLAYPTSERPHLVAGVAVIGALCLGVAMVWAAENPSVVFTPAQAAESQLRPKPAPKVVAAKPAPAAAAKAEPAAAEAEAPVANGYLCVTNSCAKVAMLPLVSEADQAAAQEAAEAAQVPAVVRDAALRLAFSALFNGGVDDGEADIVLTPAVNDDGE